MLDLMTDIFSEFFLFFLSPPVFSGQYTAKSGRMIMSEWLPLHYSCWLKVPAARN